MQLDIQRSFKTTCRNCFFSWLTVPDLPAYKDIWQYYLQGEQAKASVIGKWTVTNKHHMWILNSWGLLLWSVVTLANCPATMLKCIYTFVTWTGELLNKHDKGLSIKDVYKNVVFTPSYPVVHFCPHLVLNPPTSCGLLQLYVTTISWKINKLLLMQYQSHKRLGLHMCPGFVGNCPKFK